MPADARVLVVGEALVDVVEGHATPGGSPANVAVGLARLDVPVALATRFGADVYGVLLAKHLANNGVRLVTGTVDPTFRTATATATLDPAGVASYDFDIDWRPPDLRVPDRCVAVHTGSIATVLAPGAAAVRDFVASLADQPVTVCLDPNARPTITPDAGGRLVRGDRARGVRGPGQAERRGLRVPAARPDPGAGRGRPARGRTGPDAW